MKIRLIVSLSKMAGRRGELKRESHHGRSSMLNAYLGKIMDYKMYSEELEKIIEAITMPDHTRITVEAFVKQARDKAEGWKDADSHPHWIPVEERLPGKQGKYMFRLSNGDMYYETYYPKLKLLDNVTHWMEIVPPRKEE